MIEYPGLFIKPIRFSATWFGYVPAIGMSFLNLTHHILHTMDIFWIRIVSQTGILLTFILYFLWSLRRNNTTWILLIGTFLYALIFEHFNMLRYAHVVGGYSYHPKSWLFLWGDVPLYIPLAWSFILATSRELTDRLRLADWSKPFSDALLALLLDLSLDVVAIRLGFWVWRGIDNTEGFFGVPADNFLGWLLVTFTFSALTRRLWRRPAQTRRLLLLRALTQWCLIPPIAYPSYLALEAIVHLAYLPLHTDSLPTLLKEQLFVLTGVLGLFLAVVLAGKRTPSQNNPSQNNPSQNNRNSNTEENEENTKNGNQEDSNEGHAAFTRRPYLEAVALHGPRHIFHLFGLIGLLFVPVATRHPALWVITLTVWSLELYVAWCTHSNV